MNNEDIFQEQLAKTKKFVERYNENELKILLLFKKKGLENIFNEYFLGKELYCASNERFILNWDIIDGSFALFDFENTKKILQGKMIKPNDGKVANNGNFIINDWMNGKNPKGTFYAFNLSGKILIKKMFKANLFNNAISQDGHFAVCQTCVSDFEKDSQSVWLFDLDNKMILSKFILIASQTGDYKLAKKYRFAERFIIDSEEQILRVIYEDGLSQRYNFKGRCLDEQRMGQGAEYSLSAEGQSKSKGVKSIFYDFNNATGLSHPLEEIQKFSYFVEIDKDSKDELIDFLKSNKIEPNEWTCKKFDATSVIEIILSSVQVGIMVIDKIKEFREKKKKGNIKIRITNQKRGISKTLNITQSDNFDTEAVVKDFLKNK